MWLVTSSDLIAVSKLSVERPTCDVIQPVKTVLSNTNMVVVWHVQSPVFLWQLGDPLPHVCFHFYIHATELLLTLSQRNAENKSETFSEVICLHVHSPVCLSVSYPLSVKLQYLPACLSVLPIVCESLCLSICLSVCCHQPNISKEFLEPFLSLYCPNSKSTWRVLRVVETVV